MKFDYMFFRDKEAMEINNQNSNNTFMKHKFKLKMLGSQSID